jgi:hypothetical protein
MYHSALWLLVTANVALSSPIFVPLMMEVICSSETSILTRVTQHDIPEDDILHSNEPNYVQVRQRMNMDGGN